MANIDTCLAAKLAETRDGIKCDRSVDV